MQDRFEYSMDDIIFHGRNKDYGAFQLRKQYDKHMARAMIFGILFSILIASMPHFIRIISGYLPGAESEVKIQTVFISDPPPINPLKMPPPPPPRINPPPIKEQIKFLIPAVFKDDEIIDESPPIPSIEELQSSVIGVATQEGETSDLDGMLMEPAIVSESAVPVVIEEDKTYFYVEQMPGFPDGQEAMYKYIYEHIRYPAIARENNISGQILIQFVVNKDGSIDGAKIIRGIGGGCDEEALRVINSMPKWKPGKHNGKTVSVTFSLPVKFVLQ